MAEENKKPADWLQKFSDRDFASASSVDVATVPSKADPKDLLFGKDGKPAPVDDEPQDETFKWDETEPIVKKYGQGMWYTDVVVGQKVYRYWGKTRTEVTKQLIQAQQHATQKIEEQKAKLIEMPPRTAAPSNLTPDTKLPYDPIAISPARELTEAEIVSVQELWQSNPSKAQRIIFQAMMGCTPEAISQAILRMDNMFARRIADEAAFTFQGNHSEDWEPTPGNTALIDAYLKERKWPVTANNLEIAFQDLKAQGKLVMPKPEVPETPTAEPVVPQVEEFTPPPPPVSIPASSAPSRPVKQEADLLKEAAAGLREMPLDEARSSLTDAFRRQRGAR
jgi:hypothetical protein